RQRRQLKTERLASTGWQERKNVPPGKRVLNDLLLERSKRDKTEVLLQQRQQRRRTGLHSGIRKNYCVRVASTFGSRRRFVNSQPIMADTGDYLGELVCVCWFDNIA